MNIRPRLGVVGISLELSEQEMKVLLNYLYWGCDILEETINDDPGMTGLDLEDVEFLNKLLKELADALKVEKS